MPEKLLKDALAGNAEAMFQLGTMYAFGNGVTMDLDEALHWLKKAAKAGHPTARMVLEDIERPLNFSDDESAGAVGERSLSTGDTKTIVLPGGAEMEMIYCAPGSFIMGSPADDPDRCGDEVQHKVILTKGFWLGKYTVTQAQWESVMGHNPSKSNKGYNYPVDSVWWNDCNDFIEKINSQSNLNARFPTEAEWEYACRAGTTTVYYWGNFYNSGKLNCDGSLKNGCFLNKTTTVGSYGANPWGFYDMHGNVSEWCADFYGSYPTRSVIDPIGVTFGTYHITRGGSYHSYTSSCRSANRGFDYTSYKYKLSSFGFRLACSAGPHE